MIPPERIRNGLLVKFFTNQWLGEEAFGRLRFDPNDEIDRRALAPGSGGTLWVVPLRHPTSMISRDVRLLREPHPLEALALETE